MAVVDSLAHRLRPLVICISYGNADAARHSTPGTIHALGMRARSRAVVPRRPRLQSARTPPTVCDATNDQSLPSRTATSLFDLDPTPFKGNPAERGRQMMTPSVPLHSLTIVDFRSTAVRELVDGHWLASVAPVSVRTVPGENSRTRDGA